jgi:hypothetical protein
VKQVKQLTIFECPLLLDDLVVLVEAGESERPYSCIVQLVLMPDGASPTKNTKYFFTPTLLPEVLTTGSSMPIGFQ